MEWIIQMCDNSLYRYMNPSLKSISDLQNKFIIHKIVEV